MKIYLISVNNHTKTTRTQHTTTMSTRNFTFSIPDDKADKFLEAFRMMGMTVEETKEEEEEEESVDEKKDYVSEDEDEGEIVEVEFIRDHKSYGSDFSFQAVDKTGDSWWIDDNDIDTNCEIPIAKYCHKMRISTVYCFVRVSTDNQTGPEHVSIDTQKEKIMRYYSEHNLVDLRTRVKVIQLTGSAYRNFPTVFREVVDYANRGDSIIVYRPDRLSRNFFDVVPILKQLLDNGIGLHSTDGTLPLSFASLAHWCTHLIDANKESMAIGTRVRDSIAFRRNRGDHIGTAPYGKRIHKTMSLDGSQVLSVRLVNDSQEQRIIKMIKKMHSNGHTAREILRILNHRGYKKRGKRWTVGMIRRVWR